MRRSLVAGFGGIALSLLMATSALGFECTNLSKPPAAGTQVVFAGPACRGLSNLGIFFEQCVT